MCCRAAARSASRARCHPGARRHCADDHHRLTSATSPAAAAPETARGTASDISRPATGATRRRPTSARRLRQPAPRSKVSPRSRATAGSRWDSTITRAISAPRCGTSLPIDRSIPNGPATTSTRGTPWPRAEGGVEGRDASGRAAAEDGRAQGLRWRSRTRAGRSTTAARPGPGRLALGRHGAREPRFGGPVSIHLEYKIPEGTRHTLQAAMRDLAFARRSLAR